jgi:hypothetical protein
MHHPVHSYDGWECPRAVLLRRQYRTSITGTRVDEVVTVAPFPDRRVPPSPSMFVSVCLFVCLFLRALYLVITDQLLNMY